MAQDGTTAGGASYTLDNVTFPVGRTKLQSIFDAIRSTNIGNDAPDLVAGQFWIDNNTPSTTVWTMYFYDGTDSIQFATIDTINNTVNFIDSTFDLINDTTPQLGGTLDANGNDIDMGTNLITDTKVGQWDTAYSWGDHSTEGYITASSTDTLTNKSGNISQWTNDAGYITSETDSQTLSFSNPNLSISNGNSVDLSALDTGILNVVEDTTPQLGGNLSTNGNDINFGDNDKAQFGASNDLQIYHDGTNSLLSNLTGEIIIRNNSDDKDIYLQSDNGSGSTATYVRIDGSTGSVDLRHYGDIKLATTSTGVTVTGVVESDAPTRHSIRPSLNLDFANSKVLDPRITFTRASSGVYYDGYSSVKAEENLVKYSQEFDNSFYGKNRASISANQTTAPDGTTTADELIEDTSTNNHRIYVESSTVDTSKVYTSSVFVKANTRDGIFMRTAAGSTDSNGVKFDVGTQTITDVGVGADSSSITDVGNGWYRCSMTFTPTLSTLAPYISLLDSSGNISYTGDGSSSLYIWGLQFEQRDSLTAYTPTTTSPITKYQPQLQTAQSNVARFDHNPTTGESLGLLIEESRTNLNTFSAPTSVTNGTTFTNSAIAPDGTLTASEIKDNGTAIVFVTSSTVSLTAGNDYTFSYYAKLGSYTGSLGILIYGTYFGGSNLSVYFDLSTGTVSGTPSAGLDGYGITDVGNGWYRIYVTATCVTSGSQAQQIIRLGAQQANKTFYAWGFQVEEGSFPTSYIKTTGSQVTRSGDDAIMYDIDQSDWFNPREITIIGQADTRIFGKATTYERLFSFTENNVTNVNNIWLASSGDVDNTLRYRLDSNGSAVVGASNYSYTESANTKFGLSIKENDFGLTVDGGSVDTDTSCNMPVGLNILNIGRGYSQTNYLGGCMKFLKYYPKALTDNEIVDLTEA